MNKNEIYLARIDGALAGLARIESYEGNNLASLCSMLRDGYITERGSLKSLIEDNLGNCSDSGAMRLSKEIQDQYDSMNTAGFNHLEDWALRAREMEEAIASFEEDRIKEEESHSY